jgi:protein-tyrosine phosphatase
VIDLHSHILPGLDDGARDVEVSVEMARVAVAEGTRVIVGTPHVNHDYGVEPSFVRTEVLELGAVLAEREVPLTVVPGAEVALSRLPELDEEALAESCIARGPYLLVESPYSQAVPFLEEQLFRLRAQGFRPMLAHPERCPLFQMDPERLARLVRQEVLCSVTAASMEGHFGRTVRRFTGEMFREGLVHDVASDAHDAHGRPPGLERGFHSLDEELPGIAQQVGWYTREAPEAVLNGELLPRRPRPPRGRPARRLRLTRRR